MGRFLLGMLVGGGLMYGTITQHLVRGEDGFHLVPKLEAGFGDTYVDIRQFGLSDWAEHRAVAAAIIRAEKEDLLRESASDNFRDSLRSAVRSITDRKE